jgi:hypothetical protein
MGQFVVEMRVNGKPSSPGLKATFEALAMCKTNEDRAGYNRKLALRVA